MKRLVAKAALILGHVRSIGVDPDEARPLVLRIASWEALPLRWIFGGQVHVLVLGLDVFVVLEEAGEDEVAVLAGERLEPQ